MLPSAKTQLFVAKFFVNGNGELVSRGNSYTFRPQTQCRIVRPSAVLPSCACSNAVLLLQWNAVVTELQPASTSTIAVLRRATTTNQPAQQVFIHISEWKCIYSVGSCVWRIITTPAIRLSRDKDMVSSGRREVNTYVKTFEPAAVFSQSTSAYSLPLILKACLLSAQAACARTSLSTHENASTTADWTMLE